MAEPSANKKAGFEAWAGNTKAFFNAQRETRANTQPPAAAEIPYNPDLCQNFRHSGWTSSPCPRREGDGRVARNLPETHRCIPFLRI